MKQQGKGRGRFKGMTGRHNAVGRGSCLLVIALSLCLFGSNSLVLGDPEPIPTELLYSDSSFVNDAENLLLLNKLRQVMKEEREDMAEREKALNDVQMVIQSLLEARASVQAAKQNDFSAEELVPPSAVINQPPHSGKRTAISYMTLCHFKICNMGRKRQLSK